MNQAGFLCLADNVHGLLFTYPAPYSSFDEILRSSAELHTYLHRHSADIILINQQCLVSTVAGSNCDRLRALNIGQDLVVGLDRRLSFNRFVHWNNPCTGVGDPGWDGSSPGYRLPVSIYSPGYFVVPVGLCAPHELVFENAGHQWRPGVITSFISHEGHTKSFVGHRFQDSNNLYLALTRLSSNHIRCEASCRHSILDFGLLRCKKRPGHLICRLDEVWQKVRDDSEYRGYVADNLAACLRELGLEQG